MKFSRINIRNHAHAGIIMAVSVFTILMIISLVFINNFSMRIKQDEESKATVSYFSLNEEIQEFKNENVSLLSGFTAYIQLSDMTNDAEIYQFLDFLLKDHLDDIRNIGILEDTTIKWNYPIEGNEAAIGIDLAAIPDQKEEVLRVKNNYETLFVGPVKLVQGGEAFIVRSPILKNNVYWGMSSIVLKAENAFNYVDSHSDTYKMDYLLTLADQPDDIIYGDAKVLTMSPLKFRTEEAIGGWDVYVVPKGGWDYRTGQVSFILVACLIFSLLVAWTVYSWMNRYSEVLEDKVKLESKYILDRFTKIYNREYFNLRLKEEVNACTNTNRAISMIYFDLDHFKEVNDVYGHASGDDVLIEVVNCVKLLLKPHHLFARWGGDEFIILLPDTDLQGAALFAETVRQSVEQLEINKAYGVTASLGCSQWVNNEYVESWFIRTDKALYHSKHSGRNRITSSDPTKEANILTRMGWDNLSLSGNKTIDDEHKSILERCNRIVESALEQSTFDETIRNVELVIHEMEQHFNDEIQILKEIDYPYIENHQRIHDNLLAKTNEIFQKTIQRDITAVEFFSFLLLTVVEGHFKNEDVKYFSYLEGKTHHK